MAMPTIAPTDRPLSWFWRGRTSAARIIGTRFGGWFEGGDGTQNIKGAEAIKAGRDSYMKLQRITRAASGGALRGWPCVGGQEVPSPTYKYLHDKDSEQPPAGVGTMMGGDGGALTHLLPSHWIKPEGEAVKSCCGWFRPSTSKLRLAESLGWMGIPAGEGLWKM